MKEAIFFCIVGLPLFGKEGSGTPVFNILVRALNFMSDIEYSVITSDVIKSFDYITLSAVSLGYRQMTL